MFPQKKGPSLTIRYALDASGKTVLQVVQKPKNASGTLSYPFFF